MLVARGFLTAYPTHLTWLGCQQFLGTFVKRCASVFVAALCVQVTNAAEGRTWFGQQWMIDSVRIKELAGKYSVGVRASF